jgi:hypothetical protein
MDFDHVRGSKAGNVSEMIGSATVMALLTEIAKCDVVCANCHRLRTYSPREARSSTRQTRPSLSVQLVLALERPAAYALRTEGCGW